MSNKEPSDHIVYRNMALFISSCWFYLTTCVFFLIKFIARHVFRIKMEDSSQKSIRDCSVMLEPVPETNEIEEREFNGFGEEEEEEEEPSSFSFKFEYQIPKVNTVSYEEPSVSITEGDYHQAKNTTISNYRFSSDRDFSGFVEEPETTTFRVHEAFVDNFNGGFVEDEAVHTQVHQSVVISNENRLESKFLSQKSFSQPVEEPEEKLEAKFLSEKDFRGFNQEPETAVPVQVHESCADGSEEKLEPELLSEKDIRGPVEEPVCESFVKSKLLLAGYLKRYSMQSPYKMNYQKSEGKRPISMEINSFVEKEASFSGFDSDSDDSMSLSDGYSVKNLVVDSESDGFLTEKDFGDKESLICSSTFEMELVEDIEKIGGGHSSNSSAAEFSEIMNRSFNEIEKNSDEWLRELQSAGAENNCSYTDRLSQDETWSENGSLEPEGELIENGSLEPEGELKELSIGEIDETELPRSSVHLEFVDSSDDDDDDLPFYRSDRNNIDESELSESELMHENFDISGANGDDCNAINDSNQGDEVSTKTEQKHEEAKPNDLSDEDLDELESLWEHQDLIEQLKMELKRVRAIGLPTIFEESESPRTIEDLKPWKFDEKFLREDPMDELHKFYKSYRERMRKFDILNYQKMYAIGFLQLKDPLETMGMHKPLIPTIIAHLSQNMKPPCRRKSGTDPSEKFMKELQVDLETVYVGQTCLSWEFLRWQYEKARELPDSDPYRSHQYNQVAGEFQQFQVIVQRFIENESFQGPRLPNYVKNRCVLRNLLQVPVIKEDCLKDKMEERRKGNYGITSEMLEDIMEESIRVFWEFVKADKDEPSSMILKGLMMRSQAELQDPSDFALMSEIQASLQKKDKKLKDILRTGNCLVKKFKKPREDRSNQDLFFSQVDMKLVSRVLKMSRITTDQLLWCHKKLSKITFADRKIHREPSFLLFPC